MSAKTISPIRFLGLLAVGIAACGGGSDGSTGVAGIDGTGIQPALQPIASVGPIEGFGSVTVNGVTFDTSDTTITVDGEVSTQSDLGIGDVVLVEGTLNEDGATGTADSITFDDIVEGPISSIDLSSSTFVVLSQIVRVVDETSFDAAIQPAELASLRVDDIVEVSGFVDSNGIISATRIERKAELVELELTGMVSIDSAAIDIRFNINAQAVNYSTALIEGFPDGFIDNGDLVEVRGNVIDASGDLIATRVIFIGNEFGDAPGLLFFLDGFITRFTSATDFDVSGFPVTTDDQTVVDGDLTVDDLSLNSKVEIQGEIDANGILVAEFISLVPFPRLGTFFFEPVGGLDGAGLLTSQSDFFNDYASRSGLPGCDDPDIPFGESNNGEWFVPAERDVVNGALVQTARGNDLIVDLVLTGNKFDGCHGATDVENGVLRLSLRPIDGVQGGTCEGQLYWEFDYAETQMGSIEYFSMEPTGWTPLVAPFDLCDFFQGRSIQLLGDFDFFRNTVEGGITTREHLETATLEFWTVYHFCPDTGC